MTKKITLFVSTALLLTLLCGMAMKPTTVSAAENPAVCYTCVYCLHSFFGGRECIGTSSI